jgi:hypothetical protein
MVGYLNAFFHPMRDPFDFREMTELVFEIPCHSIEQNPIFVLLFMG